MLKISNFSNRMRSITRTVTLPFCLRRWFSFIFSLIYLNYNPNKTPLNPLNFRLSSHDFHIVNIHCLKIVSPSGDEILIMESAPSQSLSLPLWPYGYKHSMTSWNAINNACQHLSSSLHPPSNHVWRCPSGSVTPSLTHSHNNTETQRECQWLCWWTRVQWAGEFTGCYNLHLQHSPSTLLHACQSGSSSFQPPVSPLSILFLTL